MRKIICIISIALFCLTLNIQAQFAIRAGLNIANEKLNFTHAGVLAQSLQTESVNGFNIGLMYQTLSSKGFGLETGLVFSQKGCNFTYTDVENAISKGYKEVNYIEIPINFKYIYRIGVLGIYGTAGLYGACAFSGNTIWELEIDDISKITYLTFKDRLDFGYNIGVGIELFQKIQLGVNWSQGIIELLTYGVEPTNAETKTRNTVLSVNLSYLF